MIDACSYNNASNGDMNDIIIKAIPNALILKSFQHNLCHDYEVHA